MTAHEYLRKEAAMKKPTCCYRGFLDYLDEIEPGNKDLAKLAKKVLKGAHRFSLRQAKEDFNQKGHPELAQIAIDEANKQGHKI